jgi:hypothetical protein
VYELKEIGTIVTSKFVGTGPSSYKEKNLPGRGLTEVEKHCSNARTLKTYSQVAGNLAVTVQYDQQDRTEGRTPPQ